MVVLTSDEQITYFNYCFKLQIFFLGILLIFLYHYSTPIYINVIFYCDIVKKWYLQVFDSTLDFSTDGIVENSHHKYQ